MRVNFLLYGSYIERCRLAVFNCENMISIAAVEEVTYRQSRPCRLLGNPVAFAVVALLASGKDLSTGEIARTIGWSVPARAISLAR